MSRGKGALRLLVVEDEALVCMLIEDSLRDMNHDVVGLASTARQALAVVEREALDGALLDVNLGGGERSYPVADALQEKGIPFLFLTGYGRSGIDPRFADVPVLQKPLDVQMLARVMERHFKNGSARSS